MLSEWCSSLANFRIFYSNDLLAIITMTSLIILIQNCMQKRENTKFTKLRQGMLYPLPQLLLYMCKQVNIQISHVRRTEKCTLDKVTGISKDTLHFESDFQFYKDICIYPLTLIIFLSVFQRCRNSDQCLRSFIWQLLLTMRLTTL